MTPWFRELARRDDLALHVIFLRHLDDSAQGVGFGERFTWDIPLLDGYSSESLQLPGGAKAVLLAVGRLRAALVRYKPDIAVVTGWNEPALAACIVLARAHGLPVLVRGDSNAIKQRRWHVRLMQRALLAFASGALVVGRANRDFYRQTTGRGFRLFPGAHFVDNERFLAMARACADRATAGGAESSHPVLFVFCGKHVAFKRPDILVEAAGCVHAAGLPLQLRFVGSGEMTDQLKARCKELGLDAEFTGFLNQTELWRAYCGADVLVLPSTCDETWGLVVNEAMLFALPAIVSDEVGCGQDLVTHEETGWTFSGGADDLAARLRDAIAARHRLPALGLAARERVLRDYSMTKATDGLMLAIRNLVK